MTFYQLAAFKPWEMEVLPIPCYAPLSPYVDFHGQIGLDDCRKMLWQWPFAGWILKGLGLIMGHILVSSQQVDQVNNDLLNEKENVT